MIGDFTCRLIAPQKKRHRVVQFLDYENQVIRVITSLMNVTVEEVAGMYKSRWDIESFFRWVNKSLTVPVLFGTTENAVFNPLFAALILYFLLKFLHTNGGKGTYCKPISFTDFLRLLLCDDLPMQSRMEIRKLSEWQRKLATGRRYNFGLSTRIFCY